MNKNTICLWYDGDAEAARGKSEAAARPPPRAMLRTPKLEFAVNGRALCDKLRTYFPARAGVASASAPSARRPLKADLSMTSAV